MPDETGSSEPRGDDEPKVYRAEDVRQGQIILRKPWQRWVFVGGLVAVILVGILIKFFAG